jgi:hypothetical protein
MELSSLLSRPLVPNYIDFTRRQKGERVEKLGTEPYCNSFWLKAKVLADSGEAASTADDVASRAYGPAILAVCLERGKLH